MREYRFLGTFQVVMDGVELDLAAKPRALLATLAVQPEHVVSSERLEAAVWDGQAPAGAATTLRTYVSKLRTSLDGDVIAADSGGYRLSLGSDQRDIDIFATLVHQARQADTPSEAVAALEAALALWRGPALADLAHLDVLRGEAGRLEEQRAACVQQLLEHRLGLGDVETVITETAALLAQEPLRESLHALRMKALYQAGRQADALAAYQNARAILDEELGIEPGPALQQLQQAVLRQDPTLEGPTAAAGAAPTLPVRRIPAAVDDLIGRTQDVGAVLDLLEEHRLVSILGPGGIGKTRLAIEVAEQTPGTVLFVALAPLTEPALLGEVVADQAGAMRLPGTDPLTALTRHLGRTPALLVLDNCEHVAAAVAVFAQSLLRTLPRLRILTTTRELLDVAGEALARLDPLPTAEAIDLFRQRGAAVQPGVALDDRTAAEVVESLDRLPLAIELAASRLRGMTAEELRADLRHHLSALGRSRPGAEPRHQTLFGAIAWSEALLDEEERSAFRMLSAFVAPFPADAAAAVLGREARGVLAGLHDRSLLVRRETEDGTRYAMFATIRQYALDHLREDEQLTVARDGLLGWAGTFSEDAAAGLDGRAQAEWLHRVEEALPNLRAAMSWAMEGGNAAAGVAVAARLYRWWFTRGAGEGIRWLRPLIARAEHLPALLRAKALYALGSLEQVTGSFAQAAETLRDSLALYADLDDPRGEAFARHYLGRALWGVAPAAEVRALFTSSLAAVEAIEDPVGIGLNHLLLAVWEGEHGTLDAALGHIDRCGAVFDAIGAPHFMAHSRDIAAVMQARRGDVTQAARLAVEGLELYAQVGNDQCLAHALENAAHTLVLLGDHVGAAEVLGVGMGVREEVHIPIPPYEQLFHERTLQAVTVELGRDQAEASIALGRASAADVGAVIDRLQRHAVRVST